MKISVYYPLFAWVLLTLSSYRIYIGTIGLLHSSTNNNGSSLDMYQAEFFPPKSHRVSKKCAYECTIFETVLVSVLYVYIKIIFTILHPNDTISCLYITLTYLYMLTYSNIQSLYFSIPLFLYKHIQIYPTANTR